MKDGRDLQEILWFIRVKEVTTVMTSVLMPKPYNHFHQKTFCFALFMTVLLIILHIDWQAIKIKIFLLYQDKF